MENIILYQQAVDSFSVYRAKLNSMYLVTGYNKYSWVCLHKLSLFAVDNNNKYSFQLGLKERYLVFLLSLHWSKCL